MHHSNILASFSGFEGIGYGILLGLIVIFLWCALLLTSLALGIYSMLRKFEGKPWRQQFTISCTLITITLIAALLSRGLLSELQMGVNPFSLFMKLLGLISPVLLMMLGFEARSTKSGQLVGALLLIAGGCSLARAMPPILDIAWKTITQDHRNWLGSYPVTFFFQPYSELISLVFTFTGTLGMFGLWRYLKCKKSEQDAAANP